MNTQAAAHRGRGPAPVAIALLGVLILAGYLAAFTWVGATSGIETWGAFLVAPALVLISLPLIRLASHGLGAPWFFKAALLALVAKMAAGVVRYLVAFHLYGGLADAAGYHAWGRVLAVQYAQGNFAADIERELIGTGFIRVLTGLLYTITGPSLVGAYLVYAWIGFWGLVFAVRAFRVALPEADLRRYALLVFFLPSLLFWPSGLGKEAWMMFGVGLTMYGAALLLRTGRRGAFPLLLGLAATALVRPHVSVLLVGALLAAVVLRASPNPSPLSPILKGMGFVLVLALAVLAVVRMANFLGVEEISVDSLQQEFETANSNTAQGGSAFTGSAVTNPLLAPLAVISVVFRPFPWEAGGFLPLLSSLEGVLLLVLTWKSRRRILTAFRLLRTHPYVTFCITYLVLFAAMFSGFSNFGILVRQRSLVLPAFLVLLALPEAWGQSRESVRRRRSRHATSAAGPTRGPTQRTLTNSGARQASQSAASPGRADP